MPNLEISVPHNLPQDESLSRIKAYINRSTKQFGDQITDFQQHWNDNVGTFTGAGKGLSASGNVTVSPSDVLLELALPFAATFFKSKIESTIRNELTKILA